MAFHRTRRLRNDNSPDVVEGEAGINLAVEWTELTAGGGHWHKLQTCS